MTSTGLGYIVLEYAPGGSYKELIRKRPLTADQMLDLGIKLCSALFTAHCKGILHRDIKPANILITPQGLPVLADFGISTNVYQAGTQTGFSVPWAAPEVLTGRSGGTEAADIYSLVATLYATLTGRSPYEHGYQAHTQQELAQVIVSRRLPPIGRPDVPADVERVLAKGLDKNPDNRYGTALEFARAMQQVQQAYYGHATPVTVEGVPEYPSSMTGKRRVAPGPANVTRMDAPTGAWKKPLADHGRGRGCADGGRPDVRLRRNAATWMTPRRATAHRSPRRAPPATPTERTAIPPTSREPKWCRRPKT